jgi:hypothetical protein
MTSGDAQAVSGTSPYTASFPGLRDPHLLRSTCQCEGRRPAATSGAELLASYTRLRSLPLRLWGAATALLGIEDQT